MQGGYSNQGYSQGQQQQAQYGNYAGGWPHAPSPIHPGEMVASPSGGAWPEMSQMHSGANTPAWAAGGHGNPYVSPYMMPTPNLPPGLQLPGGGEQQHSLSYPAPGVGASSAQNRMSRPKHSSLDRARTMPQPRAAPAPARLKSALKRGHPSGHNRIGSLTAVPSTATAADLALTASTNGLGPGGMPNISRTNSRPRYDRSHHSLPGISRQNSNSALDAPDHLFVSFNSSNELMLDQLNPVKDVTMPIMEAMLPMWVRGAIPDTSKASKFRVRFEGAPWSSQGTDAIVAYRMIICLFHIFAAAGYQWIAQVDVAHPMRPPRQVFAGKVPDRHAHFFVITFSRAGHKLTLVDPPPAISDTLAVSIRTAFKGQITSDYGLEPGVHVIEFKRNVFGTPEADKTVITGYVLKYIKGLGYKLIATVPLARKGMLGLGGRKELWMFQGPPAKRMDID